MAFQNYAEPIEYLVNNYFERKRFQAANSNRLDTDLTQMHCDGDPKDLLPGIPCKILRDSNGKVYKFIYGDTEALELVNEASPVIWQQELVRNSDGKLTGIIITYPDGETVAESLIRDEGGKVVNYTIEQA